MKEIIHNMLSQSIEKRSEVEVLTAIARMDDEILDQEQRSSRAKALAAS